MYFLSWSSSNHLSWKSELTSSEMNFSLFLMWLYLPSRDRITYFICCSSPSAYHDLPPFFSKRLFYFENCYSLVFTFVHHHLWSTRYANEIRCVLQSVTYRLLVISILSNIHITKYGSISKVIRDFKGLLWIRMIGFA